ncbi:hypothetical protein GO986_11265 [Deinococcus sp. HMF7620]|uniref:Uncharacterized protein n=1 Tax=Deinococcus arboris TaxID=2682977 RepID=A0A7C9HS87_9DEIO|nr:hypothetical protein [Deinococcus arboris]MVN87347.1 hypothetical protein [Deinococcus arboris]
MSNDRHDPPSELAVTNVQTGFETPDPKDHAQTVYTTTPADDHVSSADEGKYVPVEVPSAREVTGQFDHLATRDVVAMEHEPQDAEFAGAQTVAGLGGEHLDALVPSSGLGINASTATATEARLSSIDPNPGYTPPSEKGPPHVSQRPGDLPSGETSELQHQVHGDGDRSF